MKFLTQFLIYRAQFFLGLAFLLHPLLLQAASSTDALNAHLKQWQSVQTVFTQTIKNEKGRILQKVSGKMSLVRPQKFRWETTGRPSQLIVGDGKQLWIYDRDLDQVTIKSFQKSFQNTPALLLTDGDQPLDRDYQIQMTRRGNQERYILTPKNSENYFSKIQFTFTGNALSQMELRDQLGQTTVVQFSQFKMNLALPSNLFHFSPPANADVVKER